MINPVNNRGYNEYKKVNTQMGGMDTGEKFALNYDSPGGDTDSKDDKKAVKETDGVVVEFSDQSKSGYNAAGNGMEGGNDAGEKTEINQTFVRAGSFIRNLITAVIRSFSDVRQKILDFWNSDSSSEVVEVIDKEDDIIDETDKVTEEAKEAAEEDKSSAEIMLPDSSSPDYVEQIQTYLENSEQTAYVKNSDLLTYYDRNGRIVQLSGSDRNRILNGDKRDRRFM